MSTPDLSAIVKKWCTCADDYTLRGRVDPECRCDAWSEALEEAYKAGYIKGSDDMGSVIVRLQGEP